MANRPLLTLWRADTAGADPTFTGLEQALGEIVWSPQMAPAGTALDATIVSYFTISAGSVTLRLRMGDPSTGTVLATLTTSASGTIVSATGTFTAPATPQVLYLTAIATSGIQSMKMCGVTIEGDTPPINLTASDHKRFNLGLETL